MHKNDVHNVKIDISAVLKIIKHAKEANFKLATGQLHGIFKDGTIEISNCYPVPNREDEGAEDDYDSSMMNRLNEISLDNNKVGWYQISYANDHLHGFSAETHFEYQSILPYAIYFVYDILELERGAKVPFRALRITDKFMKVIRDQKVDFKTLKNLNFKLDQIYEQIPVEITKSPLATAFLYEQKDSIRQGLKNQGGNLDLLAYLERNISFLSEALDDQTGFEIKFHHDYYKSSKNETKASRESKIEIIAPDFVETFISKQRINNFCDRINNLGNLQLQSSKVLGTKY